MMTANVEARVESLLAARQKSLVAAALYQDDIHRIANGGFNGSNRDLLIVQLLAAVVVGELSLGLAGGVVQ